MISTARRSVTFTLLLAAACIVVERVDAADAEGEREPVPAISSGLSLEPEKPLIGGEIGSGLDLITSGSSTGRDPWRAVETVDPWAPGRRDRAIPKLRFEPKPFSEIIDPWAGRSVHEPRHWTDIIDPWAPTARIH